MTAIVGCDVSKEWIDVHVLDPESNRRVRNAPGAIDKLVQSLPAGSRIGMEATGTMHELMAARLVAAGHVVYVINPRWIHAYAKALGQRGKTDRQDAALIARFVAAEHRELHEYVPPSPEQAELQMLLRRRIELVKLKTATRQSLGVLAKPVVTQFNKLLREIERRIETLITENPQQAALSTRLRTIPGVGPVVVAHLVQVLTRFPFGSAEAFVAHTGTDPRPNDSGTKQGRRRLTHHGDRSLRHMLFLAALAAVKVPVWRVIYEAQRRKGLPSTGAIIVLARKIARIAFHIYKTGDIYDPTRIGVPNPA